MKRLIAGQTIKCDMHDAGSGQQRKWGDGLHIHKRMHGDVYGSAQIRIPIDSDKKMTITARGGEEIKMRLIKEIRVAFKDKQKRTEFVEGLVSEIRRFSDNQNTEEKCRDAAKRIARLFGLNDKIIREIIEKIELEMTRYTSIHNDMDGKLYYFTQSRGAIIASELRPRSRIIENMKGY